MDRRRYGQCSLNNVREFEISLKCKQKLSTSICIELQVVNWHSRRIDGLVDESSSAWIFPIANLPIVSLSSERVVLSIERAPRRGWGIGSCHIPSSFGSATIQNDSNCAPQTNRQCKIVKLKTSPAWKWFPIKLVFFLWRRAGSARCPRVAFNFAL